MWVIKITKEHGKIVNRQEVMQAFDLRLQTMSNGVHILTESRLQITRTNRQNRLMWAWFATIAQEWSEAAGRTITPQDVHDIYCLTFIPKYTPKGNVAGETKKLTTEQMSEFLEKVRADAAQTYGITLPDSDEYIISMWEKTH